MAQIDVGFSNPPQGRTGASANTEATEIGALQLLSGATEQFQRRRLGSDVRETAEQAGNFAESVRDVQRQLGTESPQQGLAGFQQTDAAPDEFESAKEETRSKAQKTFDKYSKAIKRGATSRTAARISIESRMQELINENPGFADTIRQEAGRAMGTAQFQFQTAGFDAPSDDGPVTELDRDLAENQTEVEQWAQLNNITDPQVKQQRLNELNELTIERHRNNRTAEAVQSRFAVGDARTKALASDADLMAQQASTSSWMSVQDVIGQDGQIKQEQVAELQGSLQRQRAATMQSFDNAVQKLKSNGVQIDPEQVDKHRQRIASHFDQKIEWLNNTPNVASVMETMRKRKLGAAKDQFMQALPFTTAISKMYGENADQIYELFSDPNSPQRKALQTRLKNTGEWDSFKFGPDGEVRSDEEVTNMLLRGLPQQVGQAIADGSAPQGTAQIIAAGEAATSKSGQKPEGAAEAFNSLRDQALNGNFDVSSSLADQINASANSNNPDQEDMRRAKEVDKLFKAAVLDNVTEFARQARAGGEYRVEDNGEIRYKPPGLDSFVPTSGGTGGLGKGFRLWSKGASKFRSNTQFSNVLDETPVSELQRQALNYIQSNADQDAQELRQGVRQILEGGNPQ